MTRLLFAMILSASCVSNAFAWGGQGHGAVGDLAQQLLAPAEKTKIMNAVGLPSLADDAFAHMATWPDDIKDLEKPSTRHFLDSWTDAQRKEGDDFLTAHPDHHPWHYVDLPRGSDYPSGTTPANAPIRDFTRPDDVVGMLKRFVGVLEGTDNMPNVTKLQALRYVIHLAGDIHQPVHVGAGYFLNIADGRTPSLVPVGNLADAKKALNARGDDHGANKLYFSKNVELHGTWDNDIPLQVAGSPKKQYQVLAAALHDTVKQTSGTTPGDYHDWPETWASESSHLAATVAYAPLKFGAAHLNTHDLDRIDIGSPTQVDYQEMTANVDTARAQLAKASARLAELLRRIKWQ